MVKKVKKDEKKYRKRVKISNASIETFTSDDTQGFVITWDGNIGFGEYTVYQREDGSWVADSECMDKMDDHWFFDLLMKHFWENEIKEVR